MKHQEEENRQVTSVAPNLVSAEFQRFLHIRLTDAFHLKVVSREEGRTTKLEKERMNKARKDAQIKQVKE